MNTKPISTQTKSAIVAAAAITLTLPFAVAPLVPPAPLPIDAPASKFSASRARRHIEAIAVAPHPMGSPAHETVRTYILQQLAALGLDGSVQQTEVVTKKRGEPPITVQVNNVLATIKGVRPSKAVLLVAHYDSTAKSPGASDNSSGVATILETARALRSNPQVQNDIMLLFTDGEELGLLGARAFVNHHPSAANVGIVLNFDARGSSGPAVMFEMAGPAGWIIREFAKGAPYPVATSFSNDVYRKMPNSTDFAIFRNSGYSGLNFAFFAEPGHYHNSLDSINNLDWHSLQHQGSYALALAREFGSVNLSSPANTLAMSFDRGSTVYFNLGRSLLVHYPDNWAMPLNVLASILWFGIVALEIRNRALTVRGLAAGTVAAATAVLITAAIGFGVEHFLAGAMGAPERSGGVAMLYLGTEGGFALITVSTVYRLAWYRTTMSEMLLPIYACWVGLALSLGASGGSYLFVWPAITGLLSLAAVIFVGDPRGYVGSLSLAVGAFPALILLVPTIGLVYYALGSPIITIVTMALLALIVQLLVPALRTISRKGSWRIQTYTAVLTIALILVAMALQHLQLRAEFSQPKRARTSIINGNTEMKARSPSHRAAFLIRLLRPYEGGLH